GSVEIRFPFLGVTHQDIECAWRATIGKRLAVQPGGDVGNVRRGERELGHTLGGDAVLHDGRNQLPLLIPEHHLVTDQVRAGFSAPGIRAMAEAAIAPEDLPATGELLGRGGRVLRIVRSTRGSLRGRRRSTQYRRKWDDHNVAEPKTSP